MHTFVLPDCGTRVSILPDQPLDRHAEALLGARWNGGVLDLTKAPDDLRTADHYGLINTKSSSTKGSTIGKACMARPAYWHDHEVYIQTQREPAMPSHAQAAPMGITKLFGKIGIKDAARAVGTTSRNDLAALAIVHKVAM